MHFATVGIFKKGSEIELRIEEKTQEETGVEAVVKADIFKIRKVVVKEGSLAEVAVMKGGMII